MHSQRLASVGGMKVAGGVAAIVLLLAALVVLASGDAFRFVTGLPRSEALSAPDDVHGAARDDPMPFLISRDVLEVKVDSPVTVRELLEGNRLNKPNLRRQVLEQLGNPSLDSTVAAGTTLRLNLTPEAADIPATSTGGKRR